jgi:hypothetical protein
MIRSDFPVFAASTTRSKTDAPIMLDGMDVLYDKVVGLAPVTLVPTKKKAAADHEESRR